MECNLPAPSIKTGSTPEIEYVKRVLLQTATYAHRTQCSAAMWHPHYLKCLVHLAKMQSSAFTLIDNRRKDLDELEEELSRTQTYLDKITQVCQEIRNM